MGALEGLNVFGVLQGTIDRIQALQQCVTVPSKARMPSCVRPQTARAPIVRR
jgi:hypothetical protein